MLIIAAGLLACTASTAIAQKGCVKGIPCGNSCVAASKTCRVGSGSANSTRPQTTTAAATPAGAQYVASSRGQVYYWTGCGAWKSLSAANLIYFKTAKEAQAAGYRPSASSGCAGPAEDAATIAATDAGETPRVLTGQIAASCEVSRIIDGDTFECSDGNHVRLLLVDAPEMNQGLFGALAKTQLESLLQVGAVAVLEMDVEQRDRYGRILAHVRNGAVFVNRELVRSGMAVVSVYPPNVKYVELLRVAADSAKSARAGLWATSAFECLPADHRAGRCSR